MSRDNLPEGPHYRLSCNEVTFLAAKRFLDNMLKPLASHEISPFHRPSKVHGSLHKRASTAPIVS